FGPGDRTTLIVQDNLAGALTEANRAGEALEVRRAIVRTSAIVDGAQTETTLRARYNLALTSMVSGEPLEALKELNELLPVARSALPERDLIRAVDLVASALVDLSCVDAALSLRRELYRSTRSRFPRNDVTTRTVRSNLRVTLRRYYGLRSF